MKRKIILTGSKGFVGKNIFEYFKKKNIHIIKIPTKSFLTKKNHLNNITHILHVGFDMRKNNANVNFETYVNEFYKVYKSVNVLNKTIINDYQLPNNICSTLTQNYKKMCDAPVLNKNECKDLLLSQAQINRQKAKKELEQAHQTLKLVNDLN